MSGTFKHKNVWYNIFMPRAPRTDVAGEIYHLINRANARLPIFHNDDDYLLFESLLWEAKELIGIDILAYCLMPNHWHLVLAPERDGDISIFMHWLTLAHTQRYHAIHKTTGYGHIYQGRYKSFIVQQDIYLLQLIRYVERNALRAKLVTKAEGWRWSSLWRKTYGTINQKKIISSLPIELPGNYLAWINQREIEETLTDLRRSVNRGVPYGREDWVGGKVDVYKLGVTVNERGRPKRC